MPVQLDELYTRLGFRVDLSKLTRFERGVSKARQSLDGISAAAGRMGTVLTGAATGAVAAFTGFEAEMTKIVALVGISQEQLDDWKDDILAISRETGQAPRALAESLFFVTSAGLRGSAAIDVLRESAKAAAAGLGDQKAVVDLVTSAVNAYGIENLSAKQATDQLVAAVRLGKLEPAQLAGAMGRAIPVASAMGVKFHEVAGLLAAMSRTGTTAEEGVTQISAVLTGILKPAEGAQKALSGVGLSMDDLRDALPDTGLFGLLRTLQTAFQGNNQALVEVFPNVRALRGIFDLLGPGMQANTEILGEMAVTTGDTAAAFAAGAGTINRKWNQALAGGKSALIAIGEELKPVTVLILDLANRAADMFLGMSAGAKAAIGTVLTLGPALLGVAAAAKALSIALGVATVAMGASRVAAAGASAAWLGMAASIRTASYAILGTWNLAYASMVRTFRIGGIAGLFRVAFFNIRTVGVAAFAAIGLKATAIFAGIKAVAAGAFAAVAGVSLPVVAAIAAAAAILLVAWKPVSTFFRGFWTGLTANLGEVGAAFGRLWAALGPIATGIEAGFRGIGAAFSWLAGLLPDLTAAGEGFGSGIINSMVAVIDAITAAIEWIKGLDLRAIGFAFIDAITGGILSGAVALYEGVKSVFGKIAGLLPESDAREGPLSNLTAQGRALVDTLSEGIRQARPIEVALAGALSLPMGLALGSLAPDLDALAGPLPPPSIASAAGQAGQRQPISVTVTFGEGAIRIDAASGDPEEINDAIAGGLADKIRSAVEEADSQVLA